jgi:hypothetical protein
MSGSRAIGAAGVLAVVVMVGAGCGSSASKAGPNRSTSSSAPALAASGTTTTAPRSIASATTVAPKDPCTYVSAAEVASATGKTVTGSSKANDFVCSYATGDSGTVNIGVVGPTTQAIVEGQMKNETAAGTLPPPLSGLGDHAYKTLGGVEVISGTTSIRITVFGGGSYAPDGNAAAVALARLIIGRM